jgi:chemotaxis protein MotB
MPRKRLRQESPNHDRWLVSYADFITLLFAFFVVMFASSQTDRARAQQVSDSVKKALDKGGVKSVVREILGGTVSDRGKGNAMLVGPGGTEKMKPKPKDPVEVSELLPSMHYLTNELQHEIDDGKVELRLEPRGLVVSLRQATFFPSGADMVDPKTYDTLDKIAEILRGLPNQVRLEGHTDSVPIHSARFRSNWELSAARSIALLELMTTRFKLPLQRFAIGGYGDTSPVDTNDTEAGRAHNRRVDVVILNQKVVNPPAPVDPSQPDPGAATKLQ